MFKHEKFRMSDDTTTLSRLYISPQGAVVNFFVHGVDLSVMQSENRDVDFDTLSDEELKKLGKIDPKFPVTFWWSNGPGFVRM